MRTTAGQLRDRVEIQAVVRSAQAGAGQETAHDTLGVVWGQLNAIGFAQRVAYLNEGKTPTHRLVIRASAEPLLSGDHRRLLCNGSTRFVVRGMRAIGNDGRFIEALLEEQQTS